MPKIAHSSNALKQQTAWCLGFHCPVSVSLSFAARDAGYARLSCTKNQQCSHDLADCADPRDFRANRYSLSDESREKTADAVGGSVIVSHVTQTMSSYRKGAQAKPTTAAGLRAQASTNGQSIFGNRSRINGLLGLNQNNYASLLGVKSPSLYSSGSSGTSILNKSSKCSDLFRKSPYRKSTATNVVTSPSYSNLYTTYGGTATGYGGVTLPSHTSVNALNLTSSSPSFNYLNLNAKTRPHLQKTESFSRSKIKPSLSISSKSSSLQSLTSSEGYAVSDCTSRLARTVSELNRL